MITLRRANVERLVASRYEADKFIAQGFVEVESGDKPKNQDNVFICPHCSKEYKTADGLENHLKKEHPQTGGDNDDAGTNDENNAGDQNTP